MGIRLKTALIGWTAAGVVMALAFSATRAETPMLLSFVGHLQPSTSDPQSEAGPTGNFVLRFSIYDTGTRDGGGRLLWTEEQQVAVINGSFRVLLGAVAGLTKNVFEGAPHDSDGPARWLDLELLATPAGSLSQPAPLGPRQKLPPIVSEREA